MRFPVGNTGTEEEFEKDWYIAQGFGVSTSYGFHDGVDINLKTGGDTDLGQELKAIAPGRVVYWHFNSHPTTGFGRHIVIKINGDWGSRWVHYAHCTENDFLNNAVDVAEGQIIARLGKSGTQSAHLHFAIFKADPIAFGIDNIPNTIDELNQIWEDPIAFLNTWMKPITIPQLEITDQTRIPQIDNMEVQAIRSMLNDQRITIESQNDKIANLESKISQIKTILG